MEQIEVKPNDTLVGISVRENVPVATLRRLNKLYGNEVYPGMLLKLRSPLPNKTATDASGNAVPKPTSFASSFRMATKPHDSGKSQPPSSSLLSAAKGPSIFFFGSSSSSGSSGNSSGHDKCNSSSSNLTDGISTNSTSSSGSNNTLRDSSKQTLSSVPPVVVNGYFDNPPGSESPAGKSARSRAASIESTPPVLLGDYKVLRLEYAIKLRQYLPPRLQIENWRLLYSVLNDGADLNSFYTRVQGCKYTVLIVETINGEIFGGFNSSEWMISPNFYGSGESFLFKFNVEDGSCERYPWTGDNEFFVFSSHDQIAMGGGGHGFGFVLDCDFATGESFCSATYGNPLLVNKENGAFRIKNVEVWGFEGIFGRSTKNAANKRMNILAMFSGKSPT